MTPRGEPKARLIGGKRISEFESADGSAIVVRV
jgi:hypothetical protein